MRRLVLSLVACAVVTPLAACDPDPRPGGSAAEPSVTGGPSASPEPSLVAPSPIAPRSSPATSRRPASGGAPSGAVPPPSAGELPGGLPFGERRLTGVVERSGDCTMLRVGARRLVLTGTAVPALSPGARVTVEGQVTTAGPECVVVGVTQALAVRRTGPA